ncbi:MAG: hypothetical protein KME32_32330 [Mojavia pulchra JT2-VF2]|uniref:Uncharacterized protein n=1 Tax=Mojavia pulchra JT2-VF2 TaxID=287848 RepID=A0A951Q541_9NOST|nr:hypothetical protein [Mojavia pulchra JT2-VF2]
MQTSRYLSPESSTKGAGKLTYRHLLMGLVGIPLLMALAAPLAQWFLKECCTYRSYKREAYQEYGRQAR